MAAVDLALALALILCITVLIFQSDNLVMGLQWPVSFSIAHMLHLLLIVVWRLDNLFIRTWFVHGQLRLSSIIASCSILIHDIAIGYIGCQHSNARSCTRPDPTNPLGSLSLHRTNIRPPTIICSLL